MEEDKVEAANVRPQWELLLKKEWYRAKNGVLGSQRWVGKQFRLWVVWLVEQLAVLRVDVEMQVDSLREDFVESETFLDYVHQVFADCDIDGNGKLDAAEFYAAILLVYHQLNRLPFGRKRFPPSRAIVVQLFDECYIRQQEQIASSTPEKPKRVSKRLSKERDVSKSATRVLSPNFMRQSTFSLVFFAIYLFFHNLLSCMRQCQLNPVSLGVQLVAGSLAFGLGFLLFHGTDVMVTKVERSEEVEVVVKDEEERMICREEFVALCQEHFTHIVAVETWRIASVAIALPIVAMQVKRYLFRFDFVERMFQNVPLLSEDLVIPALVSFVLLMFPFLDSMVEKELLWSEDGLASALTKKETLDPDRYKLTRLSLDPEERKVITKRRKEKSKLRKKERKDKVRSSIRREEKSKRHEGILESLDTGAVTVFSGTTIETLDTDNMDAFSDAEI